jgi:GNAT superfamily N-acetyltransferase
MIATRAANPADVEAIGDILAEALAGYCTWAPSDWAPPVPTAVDVSRLAQALERPDVWCLVALDGADLIGHVALSLFTVEDPQLPPADTINLWQLFVRPAFQGLGVAKQLMNAAVQEARAREFTRMRLWTPQGAGRARRFYEREGWTMTGAVHEHSPFGLPVVEYERAIARSG